MTFREFKASRRRVDNIAAETGQPDDDPTPGYVYASGLWAYELEGDEDEVLAVIGNVQTVGSIETIEGELYLWAIVYGGRDWSDPEFAFAAPVVYEHDNGRFETVGRITAVVAEGCVMPVSITDGLPEGIARWFLADEFGVDPRPVGSDEPEDADRYSFGERSFVRRAAT